MTVDTKWTIKRLLDWTTDFFKTKQLDPARLSAEILLAEALDCQRIELYTRFEFVPDETELSRYRDWVKRHAAGEPVAYLVGHREFFSLKFEVNSAVLIPRPETEHVVMAALDVAASLGQEISIVDVGTGSGAIAVTLSQHLQEAQLFATDISSDALAVAQRNAALHKVEDRIQFFQCNLMDSIGTDIEPQLIVSNPPYIGRSETGTVEQSVQDHEPHVALFAGDSGTDVIEPLIHDAAKRLTRGGYLIFETSPIIFDQCLSLVGQNSAFAETKSIKDFSGHLRVIQTRKIN